MKVILRPLNQDSHNLTILSISSKVTEPIITKFHMELPLHFFISRTNGSTLCIASSTQVQKGLFYWLAWVDLDILTARSSMGKWIFKRFHGKF